MAKQHSTLIVLLFGSILTFYFLSKQFVFASVELNKIEPVVSNVYYLQDYCDLPEVKNDEDLEEKYRHRRSSKSTSNEGDDYDEDHDHDHDHDHIPGLYLAEGIPETVKYYASKGYKRIKDRINREREIQRKWKQIFLDPISQPSVVIRLWRPHGEYHRAHRQRILKKVALQQSIRCKILLRMFSNTSDSSLNSLANSTLGAVVNFLRLNNKYDNWHELM